MALTRITKGVIKPNENYDTHNINSTGIVTAIGANFTGDVSAGGVTIGTGGITGTGYTINTAGIVMSGGSINLGNLDSLTDVGDSDTGFFVDSSGNVLIKQGGANAEYLKFAGGGLDIKAGTFDLATNKLIIDSGTNNGTNVSMLFYNGNGSSTGMGAMARIVAVDEGSHNSSLQFETVDKSGVNNTTNPQMKLTKDGRLGIGQVSLNSIDSKLFIETSGTSTADGITFKSAKIFLISPTALTVKSKI